MSAQPKRKRRENNDNRMALITVTVVLIALAILVGMRATSLKKKEALYSEKEASLLAQVAEQEERAEKLEEYRVYVQTKQYIEKEAKEKFGLVDPDEILLKPNP